MSNEISQQQGSMCCSCGQRQVFPAEIEYRTTIVLDRHTHEVAVSGLPVRQCRACQEVYFGNRADRAIDEALRRAAGLLTAAEITDARRAIGVESQRELADLIGVAPASLSRWMKGHVVQGRLADTVLRVFFGVPEARTFLRALRGEGAAARPIVVPDSVNLAPRSLRWVSEPQRTRPPMSGPCAGREGLAA